MSNAPIRSEFSRAEQAQLLARVAALEELLGVHEEVVLEQSKHLAQALSELRDFNAELEGRINVQTAELSETNRSLREQLDRERLMLEINNAVVKQLDLRELLRTTSAILRQHIHHDIAGISLYEEASGMFRVMALDNPPEHWEEGHLLPLEGTPDGLAFQTRQAVWRDHLDLSEFPATVVQQAYEAGVRSGCSVPLIARDRVIGVLGIGSKREASVTAADAEMLQGIANQIASAVENALNFERARKAEQEVTRQLARERLMLEINNAVVKQLDLRELLRTTSAILRQHIHHDTAGISLYEKASGMLRAFALDNPPEHWEEGLLLPLEGTPHGLAFQTRQAVWRERIDLTEFPATAVQAAYQVSIRSGCAVPLIARDRVIGVLAIGSQREGSITAADAEMLQLIANQIASAVANALNFVRARKAEQEVQRKLERERLMLEINNAVVTQLDLRELARVTAARLRDVLQHDITGISLYDPASNQFRAYMFDLPDSLPAIPEGTPMPLEGTVGGMAFLSGQPVFRNRPDPAVQASEFDRRLMEAGIQSGGVIPLIAHDRKLGFLGVGSFQEDAFSEADQELLCHIANQIAIAVENALNFERAQVAEQQAKRQAEHVQLLLQVNNAIASALDLPSLFRAVSACLRQVFRLDYAVMGLYNEAEDILRVHLLDRGEGLDILQEGQIATLVDTPVGLAIRTKQVVVTGPNYLEQFPSEVVRRAVSQGIRANCSAPLLRQNRVIGAMSIASKTEAAFTQEDGELFMRIADQVAIAVENALAFREIETLKNKLASEKLYLEDEIRTEHNFEELIGASRSFKRILKQIETVAPTDSAVLIRGETGTGKELLARAIHNLSSRRERTLVKLNCAAIPTGLLESELFGHEKGAFTGAITQRIGRFELANHGTLLLDEVGDIPVELQPKLLRVLQEQEFERLGSTRTQKVNVRMIAATNADLEQLVAEKKYRSDLYYRLNVFPITIPPLRERAEDIPLLVRFFTRKYARRMKKPIEAIPAEAMEALTAYHWPGNVRELEHYIERAVVLTQGSALEISLSELKPAPKPAAPSVSSSASSSGTPPLATLESAEREHILRALEETDWVIGGPQGAAARLGMKRTTLQSRMQKLGLTRQR